MMVRGRLITPAGEELVREWPTELFLTAHCQVGEAANVSAKDEVKFFWNDSIERTLTMFEELRAFLVAFGWVNYMPLSSVERTEEYNREIGGIEGSHHITGEAFDWNFSKGGLKSRMTNPMRKQISYIWQYICKVHGLVGYICWYTNGFHFDCAADGTFDVYDYRGTPRDW